MTFPDSLNDASDISQVQRQKKSMTSENVAKSLPMNIPVFMTHQHNINEDEEDSLVSFNLLNCKETNCYVILLKSCAANQIKIHILNVSQTCH